MFFRRGFIKRFKTRPNELKRSENAEAISEHNIKDASDDSVKAALREIFLFIIFLVAVTIVANDSQHLYMLFFNQALQRSFLDRKVETDLGIELSFGDLVTIGDWWLFMEGVLLTNLNGLDYDWKIKNSDNNKRNINAGNSSDGSPTVSKSVENTTIAWREVKNASGSEQISGTVSRLYLKDNILLGTPRLRQIRVKENSCEVHEIFLHYFVNCFAGYTKSNENNTKLHQNSKFYTMSELQVNAIHGQITTYYGAGYVINLSYNLEGNLEIIKNLKRSKWLDRGTRLVIFEFVLFNVNTNIFDNVKILAEVPPVGGIVGSYKFQAFKFHTLWSDNDWVLYVAGATFYLMVSFHSIQKIFYLKNVGVKLFFSSVWNLLDITVLLISYFSLVHNLVHPVYTTEVINRAKKNNEEFISVDNICYWNLIYIDVMAICVFLVWIKIFKYISFNKTMSQFSITLRRCAKDLFGFAVMFFIVFLAYAQLGLLIFGGSHPDFRNFGVSVVSLMRMFLGDFEYRLIEEANSVLGPIYFLTYVVFVFFILLNMFLAIINDTYAAVKNENYRSNSNFGSYFHRLFKKSFLWCRRKTTFTDASLCPDSNDEDSAQPPAPSRVVKRTSEVLREYFEQLPQLQESPSLNLENSNLQSLNKRLFLLEEVLEQLINNMDIILKTVESRKKHAH